MIPEQIINGLSKPQKELLQWLMVHEDSFVRHGVCTAYDKLEIWFHHLDKDENELDTDFRRYSRSLEALRAKGVLGYREFSPNIYTECAEYWIKKEYKPYIQDLIIPE